MVGIRPHMKKEGVGPPPARLSCLGQKHDRRMNGLVPVRGQEQAPDESGDSSIVARQDQIDLLYHTGTNLPLFEYLNLTLSHDC